MEAANCRWASMPTPHPQTDGAAQSTALPSTLRTPHPFPAHTAMSTQSAVKMKGKDFHTKGSVTLSSGMVRKSRLRASFSRSVHSRARKEGTVNILQHLQGQLRHVGKHPANNMWLRSL